MKRTGEIILGIIGVVLSVLLLFGGIFRLLITYNNSMRESIQSSLSGASSLNTNDMNMLMDSLSTGGWTLTIGTLIGLILGLIAIANIKKNKNPKKAGSLFIMSALAMGLITLGSAFLPALFYLISGIMSLVRKGKEQTAYNNTVSIK